MNKQKTEKEIVNKILGFYQDFDKAIVSIYNYTLIENPSFTHTTRYYKNESMLNIDFDISISDKIKSLLKYQFEQQLKSNKGTITIYPSGEYESEFIWYDEANVERLLKDIFIRKRTFVEYIFTSFEEDVLKDRYNHLSIVVNIKKHKEIHIERKMTTISGEIKEMALILEKRYIEAILDFQLQTNELELGEKAIKWNRATFSIPGDIFSFDPDKDVSFEWREDLA